MKNREEYLASIYAKRDSKIKERKKTISVLTSVLCLAVCFVAAFAFIPKKFGQKSYSPVTIPTAEKIYSEVNTYIEETATFSANYYYSNTIHYSGNIKNNNGTIAEFREQTEPKTDENLKTEIALENSAESPTRNLNFGWSGDFPFDSTLLTSQYVGSDKEIIDAVTEPSPEKPAADSDKTTVASTKKPKYETQEIVSAAIKHIPNNYANKIITEKTDSTVTRTANGEEYYTVYLFTDDKSFTVKLKGSDLGLIEVKEKNVNSGNDINITPAHPPETTAALPAYMPQ